MPSAGSFQRRPRAASGTYGVDEIVDPAARDAHQLRLAVRLGLPVEAAERAAPGVPRQAALHEPVGEAAGTEEPGVESAGEEAALVGGGLDLDELHRTVTSGIATTNRPPQSRTAPICSVISRVRFQGRMRT